VTANRSAKKKDGKTVPEEKRMPEKIGELVEVPVVTQESQPLVAETIAVSAATTPQGKHPERDITVTPDGTLKEKGKEQEKTFATLQDNNLEKGLTITHARISPGGGNQEEDNALSEYVLNPAIRFLKAFSSHEEAEGFIDMMVESMPHLKKEDFLFQKADSEANAKKMLSLILSKKYQTTSLAKGTAKKSAPKTQAMENPYKRIKSVEIKNVTKAVETESISRKITKSVVVPIAEKKASSMAVSSSSDKGSHVNAKEVEEDFKTRNIRFDVRIFRYPNAKYVLYGIEFEEKGKAPWGYKPNMFEIASDYEAEAKMFKNLGYTFASMMNHMRSTRIRALPYGANECAQLHGKNNQYSIDIFMLWGFAENDSTDVDILEIVKSFLSNCNNMNFREMLHAVSRANNIAGNLLKAVEPKDGELWPKFNLCLKKLKAVPTKYLNHCFLDIDIDCFVSQLFPETAGKCRDMWDFSLRNMVIGNPNEVAPTAEVIEIQEEEDRGEDDDEEEEVVENIDIESGNEDDMDEV
jgi:hypothetical protein